MLKAAFSTAVCIALVAVPAQAQVQTNDVVLGLGASSAANATDLVRGLPLSGFGAQVADPWATSSLQSVEFDNLNGVSHNAQGNLLGMTFNGLIYSLATNGAGTSQLIGDSNSGAAESAAVTPTRGGGLSVSPGNTKIAVVGFDTGEMVIYDYTAGNGDGTGASLSNGRNTVGSPFGGFDTEGSAWLDDNTAIGFSKNGDVFEVDATTMASTTVASLGLPGGASVFTDIEYNPNIAGGVYAMHGEFAGGTTNILTVLDPNAGYAVLGQFTYLLPPLDSTREISFDCEGNLYVGQFAGVVGIIPNANDVSQLADNTAIQNWYTPTTFASFSGLDVASSTSDVAGINEIRIDQGGSDLDEYFELAGAPGASLDGLTYLVIGDGPSGRIESVTDLTGRIIPSDGIFLVAETTFSLGSPDMNASLGFENSDNVTHLLVRDFSGSNGDDVDTDDDGTIDVILWSSIADCVGLVETVGSGDLIYCDSTVGPDGNFVPAHVFRCVNRCGDWNIGGFSLGADDTPGDPNTCLPLGACCDGTSCFITDDADCTDGGGTYLGDGSDCSLAPCGPFGACCLPDFACAEGLSELQCLDVDPAATFTEGGTCAVDCVPPTGSCCLLDGSCTLGVTEAECDALRGRQFTLDATDCDPACAPATPATVIISEYYESAPGRRKALEIFNTSDQPANLYGHAVVRYANFSTSPSSPLLLDNIVMGPHEVIVFINNANDDIPNFDESTAILAPGPMNHNGDDALGIIVGEVADNNIVDVFAVPGQRDFGPRGSDPYRDAAWERNCDVTTGTADFDACNFDGLKDCARPTCPRGTPINMSCTDGAHAKEWTFEGNNPSSENCHHSLGVHNVCIDVSVDIKPGGCPNPFNRKSNGVLPIAIVGQAGLPVEMIDVSTIRLTRADLCPGSGSASAHNGDTGPQLKLEDVATPFSGDLCNCHDLGGDGLDDLVVHFKTRQVVANLNLDGEDFGALVELVVSGQLLDGTHFSGRDCIRLVPPGTPPGLMSVRSTAAGSWVDISPLDRQLDGGGFANFDRSFFVGTRVKLTADIWSGTQIFQGWKIDGQMVTDQTSIKIRLSGDETTLEAVYSEKPTDTEISDKLGGSGGTLSGD